MKKDFRSLAKAKLKAIDHRFIEILGGEKAIKKMIRLYRKKRK